MVSQPQRTTTRPGYILTDSGLRRLNDARMRRSYEDIGGLANPTRDRGTVSKIFNQGKEVKRGKTVTSGSDEASIQAVFAALEVTPAPEKGFDYILYQDSDVGTSKILISASTQHRSYASQLVAFFNDDLDSEKVVWVTDDLSQDSEQPHQQLEFYDCFLLLKSADSKAETLNEELDLISQSQERRTDKRLTVVVIHIGSALCLPLNHPLNQKLRDVLQLEWRDFQKLRDLVQTLPINPSTSVIEWTALLRTIAQMNSSANWLVAYAGENQMDQFKMLTADLSNETDRRVQSRYSYWGLGPAYMWHVACHDLTYHMKENLERFPSFAQPLSSSQHFDRTQYNFVSLGAGEGTKDKDVIENFFNEEGCNRPRKDFLYIAVDMSLDLLRLAIDKIRLPLHSCIAIQRDIETPKGIEEVAFISKLLGQEKPILYGFIGNTISNVQKPHDVMRNIAGVMRDEDLLLFEAQIIAPEALEEDYEDVSRRIKNEYKNDTFLRFAESALLQYTDLPMTSDERRDAYDVVVSPQTPPTGSRLIRIDCFFRNKRSENIILRLMNDARVTWRPEECIYIYRSHKFTPEALRELVQVDFKILDSSQYLSSTQTGFMVMLLRRSEQSFTSGKLS